MLAFSAILASASVSIAWAQTAAAASAAADGGACVNLTALSLSVTSTIQAERVTGGQWQPPTGQAISGLPPFCRVHIVARPTPQSNINVELWLPESGWNGRFLGTGNGGGAGGIAYGSFGAALKRGFAVANTDLGTSPNANMAVGFPEKWADFGYRATHVMTVLSKEVIGTYYRTALQRSYFVGCSTGGEQALSEAQRYPTDYNGIIAGAPANNRTHLHSEFLWHYQATRKVEGQSFLPPELIGQVTKAVVAACAGKDGGAPTDNFLTDPRLCKFNPESLPKCSKDLTTRCATAEEVTALKTIYAGPANPRTGERIYAPLPFGAEASSLGLRDQEDSSWFTQGQMYPFRWAFGTAFDPLGFDFDKDEDQLDKRLAANVNANNPDLIPFQRAGGKLIMFTGTADPIVPFPDAVDYYERVIAFEEQHLPSGDIDPAGTTKGFFRYYLVPGMGHCGGGPGLNSIGQGISSSKDDLLQVLENWVEQDHAPEELRAVGLNGEDGASSGKIERNVCPYPEFPSYAGGDPARQSSFTCRAHPRGNVPAPASRYLY